MISWIVATNNRTTLETNLLATVTVGDEDELVVVEDAPSITVAYAEGQSRATRPVRCYIHHDVQIGDLARLRAGLVEHTEGRGMVGVIGSRDAVMPWWDGRLLGSVVDVRMGVLDFGPGGECAMLDGLLLATRQHVEWDVDAPGWHGYDHDSCSQMLARGLTNYCLTGGRGLVLHNTTGPTEMGALTGWDEAVTRWRKRWETQ